MWCGCQGYGTKCGVGVKEPIVTESHAGSTNYCEEISRPPPTENPPNGLVADTGH